jgi:hypothetical protein
MIRYVFKDKPLVIKGGAKADPQKIGEALARIREQTKGRCNSKTVLDAARNNKHYLHRFFEWRDTIAAEKYRQEQARELVGCVDIVERAEKKGDADRRLPAFISLSEKGGRNIRTVQEVLESSALQAIALKQAENDLAAYERRLEVFGDICNAIRQAREMIAARRARYEASGGFPGHA